MSTRIEEAGDALMLDVPDARRASGCFLLFWLTGWTVGCVALAWMVVTQRQPFMLLFAVPFWLSWIFVAAWVLYVFFGRQRFLLYPDGLVHEWRVLAPLSRRQVPLSEIRLFRDRVLNDDSEDGQTHGIEVVTLGRSITFGAHLSALEREWLTYRLDEQRRRLQAATNIDVAGENDPGDCRQCVSPSDGGWSIGEEFSDLTFAQRGKFSPPAILSLIFINGFWNGIVGVFVCFLFGLAPDQKPPREGEWWMLFFFLVPFEAIGLAMLLGLAISLLEPFRVTRWIFTADAIDQITTRLGLPLGLRHRYPLSGPLHATIRDDLVPWVGKPGRSKQPPSSTGDNYGLLISDDNKNEICSITSLTLGEARWMKGRLQEQGLVK